MNWIYLLIASVFEIGWPLGFKLSQTTGQRFFWISFAVLSMALSGLFLWLAQRTIPIGTAYGIWTGLGATGTLIVGMLYFNDPVSLYRLFFASMIIFGIIGLKFHASAGL